MESVFDIRGHAALSETRRAFLKSLERRIEEGGHTRRLVVLKESRETLGPFIRDTARDERMATGRIDNENDSIVIYDFGMVDGAQAPYMKVRLATLFTRPDLQLPV
jgi:hypothetical protein